MQLILNQKFTPFNLKYTLGCGQVFRWEKKDDYMYGIVGDIAIKLLQECDKIVFETFPKKRSIAFIQEYFRLDDDLPKILSKISKDPSIRSAIEKLYGLRIIRQDPWECLISYICATFSNIPRIKSMIRNLSKKFGNKIYCKDFSFYTFPTKEALSNAKISELLDCGLGYRSKYVQKASKTITDCSFDLDGLRKLSYMEAKKLLLTIPGVGPKVADCILLFSLDMLEAFPIDIWIERVVSKCYSQYFPNRFFNKKWLTKNRYEQMSIFGRDYFEEYAGYAQEYLFCYARLKQAT